MKNKFSGNTFQLTVCFSWFDPEMVWSENFHFKPFPDSRAKRERDRTQITNPEPRALRLRLRIAPRSHPSTSSTNPEPRSRLRLRRDCTPRSHQDGTDRTEIAIEQWLGFDEFDRIWWIFFGWVLFLCLSIEKLYYKFVWKLTKCGKMWGTNYFLGCNQTLENISFPKNSISGKYFTWTKHSLKGKDLGQEGERPWTRVMG